MAAAVSPAATKQALIPRAAGFDIRNADERLGTHGSTLTEFHGVLANTDIFRIIMAGHGWKQVVRWRRSEGICDMIPRRAFINAFLELSSTLTATRLFSRSQVTSAQRRPQAQAQAQTAMQADAQRLTNWSGNLTYSTGSVFYPRSVEEVASLVKRHARLKVLGTRHCFNTIADSPDHLISLKEMNHVIALDAQARTVTVEGGINYGQLCPQLQEKGFALHNLASLPHISVAGACATATHGSGVKNGNPRHGRHRRWSSSSADGTIVSLFEGERDGGAAPGDGREPRRAVGVDEGHIGDSAHVLDATV